MTVRENLLLGRAPRRPGPWSLRSVYDLFPVLEERAHSGGAMLSGGQQQMLAIGRALMTNPEALLLDEVSLGLSPLVVDRVYDSLETLKGGETAMIFVEQDLDRAFAFATRIICMLEGRIVLEGSPDSLTREDVTKAYFGLGRASAETQE